MKPMIDTNATLGRSMKPAVICTLLIALVLLLLFLPACARENTPEPDYFTTVDGQDIRISFDAGTRSEGTISSEHGDYRFAYHADGSFSVVYPNGYQYSQKTLNGASGSSWNYAESPSELGYIEGFVLEWAVRDAITPATNRTRGVSPLVSIGLLGFGLFCILAPKSLWWISRGWMYKNVEPSDLILGVYRVGGILAVLFAVLSFLA